MERGSLNTHCQNDNNSVSLGKGIKHYMSTLYHLQMLNKQGIFETKTIYSNTLQEFKKTCSRRRH